MKRRRFMQAIVAAPAAPALLAQQPAPASAPAGQPPGRVTDELPRIDASVPDAAAETIPRFFTADQFSALRRLCDTLAPPLKEAPGALDAGAPEFLDFLIGASTADRQEGYRTRLDA